MKTARGILAFAASGIVIVAACSPFTMSPQPGPDKQAVGTITGAALGAGSGAVTGAQLAAGSGPGAWVGAGLGGIFGLFSGLGIDLIEEDEITRKEEKNEISRLSWAQEVLAEHYSRRLALHPERDIFPADLFFESESTELRCGADALVKEIAVLAKDRLPWSRLMITAYATSADADSSYAASLTERRAEELALAFIRSGIDARRIVVQGITLEAPLVIDPQDSPGRYRQAIEIIPLDR